MFPTIAVLHYPLCQVTGPNVPGGEAHAPLSGTRPPDAGVCPASQSGKHSLHLREREGSGVEPFNSISDFFLMSHRSKWITVYLPKKTQNIYLN